MRRMTFVFVLTSFFCCFTGGESPAETGWIEVDGVTVVVPPSEHPRLYLRKSDLPGIRKRKEHPLLKPVWEEIVSSSQDNPQIRLEVDALQYLLDGNEELGRAAVARALSLLQKVPISESSQKNNSRQIGRLMVTGAIVYDWCYPVSTASQRTAFVAEFVRLAKALECGYPPARGSWVIGHPSEWMLLRDMLSAGIATFDEAPEMYRLAAARFFGTILPARTWWYPGHAFHQGPGYADARFVSDMYALWIFDRMGAGNVFHPSQQFVPYEWIYLRRPDNRFIRSGDGQNWPTRLGSLLCASYYKDGYVLANHLKEPEPDPLRKRFLSQFLRSEPGSKPRIIDDTKLFEFLWRDPELTSQPIEDLPLSRYFGSPYGSMVARTGWDKESVIAQMKVNIYNFGGHQHLDAGSFELYHKGPLAIHSGVYQGVAGGYGSPHHSNYYTRTIAHNSLLIRDPKERFTRGAKELANDGGQRILNQGREVLTLDDVLQGDNRTGEVLGQGFGPDPIRPEHTYLLGDLTAAYSNKVKDVKRSFVFLNLGDAATPAALVVFDRIESADPSFEKTWLLHSVEEPTIDGPTASVSLTKQGWGGRLVNTTLLPDAGHFRLSKVGGPGKEFLVADQDYPNEATPPDPEKGTWRVELSPIRAAATDLFLNVLQVTAAGTTAPLAVEKLESRDVVGARLADRVVLFSTRGNRTARPVAFEIKGNGALKILVSGLAAGVWQVRRDGRIVIPASTVSADGGALSFEGPAGSYELRR